MVDLGKFLTVMMIFIFGFTMFTMAMNQPYYALTEMTGSIEQTAEIIAAEGKDLIS